MKMLVGLTVVAYFLLDQLSYVISALFRQPLLQFCSSKKKYLFCIFFRKDALMYK